jgi:hypothetical protein
MSGNVGKMNDPDASLFIQVSEITGSTQRGAIVDLIKDLKSNGIWSKMKAIYPFVGGTASTHKWNLKDPRDTDAAFRLTFNGGWTHSATGAKPNGSNAYANTYFNSALITRDSGHMAYYSKTNRTNPAGIEVEMGSLKSIPNSYNSLVAGFLISGVNYHTGRWCNNGGGTIAAMDVNTLGFYQVNRISTTDCKVRKNATLIVTDADTIGQTSGANIFIGSTNNHSTGNTDTPQDYSFRECSYASIGTGLTDAEASSLYTIVQKYQTTLGRQV